MFYKFLMSLTNENIIEIINFILDGNMTITYQKVFLKNFINKYLNDNNKELVINTIKEKNNEIYEYLFTSLKDNTERNKKIIASRKNYYQKNKEILCEKKRIYYQEHKEEKLLKNKEYRERKKQELLNKEENKE